MYNRNVLNQLLSWVAAIGVVAILGLFVAGAARADNGGTTATPEVSSDICLIVAAGATDVVHYRSQGITRSEIEDILGRLAARDASGGRVSDLVETLYMDAVRIVYENPDASASKIRAKVWLSCDQIVAEEVSEW